MARSHIGRGHTHSFANRGRNRYAIKICRSLFPIPREKNPLRNTVSPLPWIDDMDHRTLSVTEHLKARGISRGIKCIERLGVTTVFAGRTSTRGEQHNTQKQTNNRRSAHKVKTEHDVFGADLFRRLIIVNQIINSQH